MASIQKRPNGKWRARYRDAAGREHARHFSRKVDAERWVTGERSMVQRGDWTDPARARITVGDLAAAWLERKLELKPSTRTRYASIIQRHVMPSWSSVPLSAVAYEDVAAWVGRLSASGLSGSSVRQCHRVLSLILTDAVRGKRIQSNPAEGVELPRAAKPEKRFLSAAEVSRLVDACDQNGLIVQTLAYTGLRFGELAALRVRRVDLMRRRLEVAESVTEVNGVLVSGTPKSHQRRSVPLPRFLVEQLTPLLAGRGPDDFVFTSAAGEQLRLMNFRRRGFDQAASRAGLAGLTPHELRHTAASLAIASGANVKDVQRMLGHASAAMTLDVYAGLFEDSLDDVADRMDVMARAAADSLRTNGTVSNLPSAVVGL